MSSPIRSILSATVLLIGLGCGASPAATPPPQLPTTDAIMSWIAEIDSQGQRMPGYPANQWIETWLQQQFTQMGLQDVTLDPVDAGYWRPQRWSLHVWKPESPQQKIRLDAWPVPLSANAKALRGELVLADGRAPLNGKIAVRRLTLQSISQQQFAQRFASWSYFPDDDMAALQQTWPMTERFQQTMAPEIAAGAAGFIGVLDFPWQTDRYMVPYNATPRPIPGLYLSRANGDKLQQLMAAGYSQAEMQLQREMKAIVSHNVMASLPGASDDWVVIGSHHDGPWNSAVEDASGVALVLAQAAYWAQIPEQQRPHNMLFLLNSAHMSRGAGLVHFAKKYRQFLEQQVVVEIHLEHVARQASVQDGKLVASERPEPRWWFTSKIPLLENAVAEAICTRQLERSFILPPEGFPNAQRKHPPTDAARFHPHTPIVSLLAAPMYLFDPDDRLNMVHEASLLPISQAVIDIIQRTRTHSAASLRQQRYRGQRQQSWTDCADT